MNLPEVPLLSMLKSRMSWLETRQDVLSQNVANADTPGYVAKDLKAVDFESMLKSAGGGEFRPGLAVTDPRHIAISASAENAANGGAEVETNPNGSSVSLEEEMIKVSDTQAQFSAVTNLYSKALQLMRTAIGKSSS